MKIFDHNMQRYWTYMANLVTNQESTRNPISLTKIYKAICIVFAATAVWIGTVSATQDATNSTLTDGTNHIDISEQVRSTTSVDQPSMSEPDIDAIKEVLQQLDLGHLRVSLNHNSQLSFDGFVASNSQWDEAVGVLRRDFRNLKYIDESGITTLSSRLESLRSVLRDSGLETKLSIKVRNLDIIVSGVLDAVELSVWKTAAADFRHDFGSQPQVISKVTLAKIGERPSLEITGILVSDRKRILITSDGSLYNEGQSLPDGSLIKHIKDKQVILSRSDKDYAYYFRKRG